MSWTCYIKPTRCKHNSSGFRCFEVGYCKIGVDNKAEKALKKGHKK